MAENWADRETDRILSELEKDIHKEYETAYREISEKYDKYIAGYQARDEKKRQEVANGTLSQEEYEKWRKGQILIGRRWKEMQDTLAEDLVKVDQKAVSMMNGYMPEAYALNHNYGTFEVEKGSNVDTSYTLYNRQSVERLVRDKPNLLPKRKLDIPKDKIWNKRHINSAVTQGILQGDDLRTVSKRLRQVTDMDKKAAIRNARTMMTGAQNAGRLDAYKRARAMGIVVNKEWMATLDHHTRESHAHLDGEKVDLDEKFSNGLMYPGDPDGEPSEVYNCRCTMVADTPEYPYENMTRYDNIAGKKIKNVTYKEWAEAHGYWKPENKPVKKEYDFEGKLKLFKSSKKALKEAESDFLVKQSNAKYTRNREDQMESLQKQYADVANFTDADVERMERRIEELEEEIKWDANDAHDKWYDRPSREDRQAYEEWKQWKQDFMDEHDGMTAPDYLLKLQEEKYKYEEQIQKYRDYRSEVLGAERNFKPKAEIMRAVEEAKEKYEKAKEAFESQFTSMDELLLDAYEKNVFYKKTSILKKVLDDDEIIERLGGGDMTEGSCQSLALCYAGNKVGIDVIDFRGGDSQDFFADYRISELLLKAGMKGNSVTGYNEQSLALKLLKTMEYDKEYILSGGEHAAVVKKVVDDYGEDEYKYLELQSKYLNGWKTLGYNKEGIEGELKWRFGMQKSRSWRGHKYERTVYLLDVDSAKDVEDFDTLLGFINTDSDKQMKGVKGNIK